MIEYKTSKGTLSVKCSGESPSIGDVVTLDGKPAPEGEYISHDVGYGGTSIKVDKKGLVLSIGKPLTGSHGTGHLKPKNKGVKSISELMKERKSTYKKTTI